MSSGSEEETDISDSEINEYAERPYEQLKSGKLKVKGPNGTLRCPFCAGKKKQDYQYKDLLQHATGASRGASNRSAKEKGNHLAMANYLKNDLANEAPQSSRSVVSRSEQQQELFVWPWVGIIMNIHTDSTEQKDLCSYLFRKYKPQEVNFFKDKQGQKAQAVVTFKKNWDSFNYAMAFEKSFEVRHRSKKEWNDERNFPGHSEYGWVAREDDYRSNGFVGEYLHKIGDLKTISDIVHETEQDNKLVVNKLTDEIDMRNEDLNLLEMKFNVTAMTLSRTLEEKDLMHQIFCQETRRLQLQAKENVQKVLSEQDRMLEDLENKTKQLDSWSRELNKHEALTEREKQKLDEEKKKKEARNKALKSAL